MSRKHVTVPTQPLIKYIDHHLHDYDDVARANAVGVSWHTYRSYRRRENMSWLTADRCATSLGRHPVEIWENWYEIIF